MTSEQARQNIRANENALADLLIRERDLEQKIGELQSLRKKYADLQGRFEERQQHRQKNLVGILSCGISNSIANNYHDGMQKLLSGQEFKRAYNGLSEAKQIITNKIRELNSQLDECSSQIRYKRNQISYWNAQYSAAKAEEAANSGS